MEVEHVTQEGVTVKPGLLPVEVIVGDDGRATAVRVIKTEWSGSTMTTVEGSETEMTFDLLVSAIGQRGDLTGFEELDSGRGLIDADGFYRVKDHPDLFVGGDIIKPHLLTSAIGQASIAAEGLDKFLSGADPKKRPKVDVHRFNLLDKLRETDHTPTEYSHEERHKRQESTITADSVLGSFGERIKGLTEEEAQLEANRCMSCGMCFECDNCVIFCPQDAIFRVKKTDATMGRYVDTDYTKCIGCHICEDVCPSGYIQMGLGE
jgi:formate hydrogenlyase subunit 6/NADH:ubiquinone oxidoreductase subunit I